MKTIEFSILATSDIHGYLFPTSYRHPDLTQLGLAKLSTIIQKKRQEKSIILLDNGDFIQGSPLTFYHNKFATSEPNPMIVAANQLQYDAAVFGNHEFNYGLTTLRNVMKQSHFPWLAANILDETGSYLGNPYIIKVVDGLRIAILGVTTHFVTLWEEPAHIKGLQFNDAYESAKHWVKTIRETENVDLLVLCYHGGFERNLETGELAEADTGENQGYKMSSIDGVDVLITGHQHREIATVLNSKPVVQPGTKGICLAEVSIEVEIDSHQNVLNVSYKPSLVYVNDTTETDEQLCLLAAPLQNELENWLNDTIGTVKGDMVITDSFAARLTEHPFVEFINKIQLEISGAQIASTALFHDEKGGFSNRITMRDIMNNYIYPNTLKVLLLSGEDIRLALEQCATYFDVVDGELVVNRDFLIPKAQPYNYDMWEGIEYEFTISNPVGQRVTKLFWNNEPMSMTDQFTVVMNSYRATGAGNFPMFQNKPVIKEIQTDMTELIAQYLIEHKEIVPTCNHNWIVKV
nr:bifunctional UDP-sugar hydrolase/5'-nucleotidase [Lysinibacillus timonensis]